MTCLKILRAFDRHDDVPQCRELVAADGDDVLYQWILPLPRCGPVQQAALIKTFIRTG